MFPNRKIETHAHTSIVSPCGRLKPSKLVREHLRAGYSGLIVTDHLTAWLPVVAEGRSWEEKVHNFYSGYREAYRAAESTGLSVFPGFELTLERDSGCDFLVYGIDEQRLLEYPDLFDMDLPAVKQMVEAEDALIFQAHPFRTNGPADPDLLDGIEVCNTNPRNESHNELAVEFAARHRLLGSSGSDAHRVEDIGRGGISVRNMPATIRELIRLWREAPDEIELLAPA